MAFFGRAPRILPHLQVVHPVKKHKYAIDLAKFHPIILRSIWRRKPVATLPAVVSAIAHYFRIAERRTAIMSLTAASLSLDSTANAMPASR
jgi:hypothetical protein